jgi:methyl-accepting chemotaxis protein
LPQWKTYDLDQWLAGLVQNALGGRLVKEIYRWFSSVKLFQKILLIVFGLTLPIVVLAVWLVVAEFVKVTKSDAGVRLEGLAFNAADKIDRNLFERYGDVQAFAVSKQASSFFVGEIVPWMNTMTKIYAPNYSLMIMTDLKGNIVALNTLSGDEQPLQGNLILGQNVANQAWFQTAIAGKILPGSSFVTDVHHEPLVAALYGKESDLVMSFTSAVRGETDQVIGVWTNFFDWRIVQTILRDVEESASDAGYNTVRLMIANKDDLMLANTDSQGILGRNMREFSSIKGAKQNKKGYADGFSLSELGLKATVPAVEAWSQEFGFSNYKGLGWVVGASQENSEINAKGNNLIRVVLVAALGVLLMIVLAVWLMARYLARRMDNMVGIANELAKGDIRQTITDHNRDEIGDLARAFDDMIIHQISMAKVADKISLGDLSSQVETASENDTLGLAFTRMGKNLKVLIAEVQRSSSNVSSASNQILAATSQQASGVAEQSAAITQTSATVEEVRASADQAVDMANTVNDNAQAASRVATIGVEAVEDATTGMNEIRSKVSQIAENIVALSEQTQQIGEIITSVSDLADQSNLLALNAAIEAARAGDQGKGFAVVAQEIRLLAEKSKSATAQVRGILGDIQKATNTAVMTTEQGLKVADAGAQNIEQLGQTIHELSEAIQQAAYSSQLIGASVRQHSVGMEQIASAMSNINRATFENLSTTNHTKTAAENLNKLSRRLNNLIAGYKTDSSIADPEDDEIPVDQNETDIFSSPSL